MVKETGNQTIQQGQMPICYRVAPIANKDVSERTIEVTWTAGASVRRYDWLRDRYYQEQLSQENGAVRMGTLQSGKAPFLNVHSQYSLDSVLGVIESADSPADGGAATIRFSKRAAVNDIYQDVQDGILNSVSLGARIHRLQMIAPDVEGNTDWIYRAIDWEPYEISLVPIGADPGAVVRSEEGKAQQQNQKMFACEITTVTRGISSTGPAVGPNTQKGSLMTIEELQRAVKTAQLALDTARAAEDTNANPATVPDASPAGAGGSTTRASTDEEPAILERQRVRSIREAVRASTLGDQSTLIDDYTDRGLSADAVREDVLRRMAEASAASSIRSQGGSRIELVGADQTEVRREAVTISILHRIDPAATKLTDAARAYRGLTLRELCRDSLESAGISTRGMSTHELASAALGMSQRAYQGTSDLPLIFGSVIARTMRQAYGAAPKTFTKWAKPGTIADFRPVTRAAFDAAMGFEKVGPSGEYKTGSLVESGEVIQLATFGKKLPFNRQMIINDDLSSLQRVPQFFGRAASDLESDIVYGIVTGNALMADGKSLLHEDHGNLSAAGSKISIDSLSAGRTAMRQQKAPGGAQMNLAPKFLLVPATLETIAYQYTSNAYTPTKSADQNPFNGVLEPVVEARLDAASPTQWYLLGDSGQCDTVEYCYLEGEEGLFTEQFIDPNVDGLIVKGRIDFAAKALDWRGIYSNQGAA